MVAIVWVCPALWAIGQAYSTRNLTTLRCQLYTDDFELRVQDSSAFQAELHQIILYLIATGNTIVMHGGVSAENFESSPLFYISTLFQLFLEYDALTYACLLIYLNQKLQTTFTEGIKSTWFWCTHPNQNMPWLLNDLQ